MFIETDVARKENVRQAFSKVLEKFRFIDIVIANAGILNEPDYEKTINVNLVNDLIDLVNYETDRTYMLHLYKQFSTHYKKKKTIELIMFN